MRGRHRWGGFVLWMVVSAVAAAGCLVIFFRGDRDLAALVAAVAFAVLAAVPGVLERSGRPRPSDRLRLVVPTGPSPSHPVAPGGARAARRRAPLGQITYAVVPHGTGVAVEPRWPYLDLLADGGPVPEVDYHAPVVDWCWPTVTVRVVNDGDAAVLWRSVVVEVLEVTPDLRCVPVLADVERPPRTLLLVDEGWGTHDDGVVVGSLTAVAGAPGSSVPVRLPVPRLDGTALVDLTAPVRACGVDVDRLERLRSAGTRTSAAGAQHLVEGRWVRGEDLDALVAAASGPFPHGVSVVGRLQVPRAGPADGVAFATRRPVPVREERAGYWTSRPQPPPAADVPLLASTGRVTRPVQELVGAGSARDHVVTFGSDRSA